MAESDIHLFTVDISAEEVECLQRELRDTRLPGREIVPGAGTRYGAEHAPQFEISFDLYEAWTKEYDWFAVHKEINEFPHYITPIEDVKIHSLHARAEKPDAIPLLLVHGWPGSFWEFSQDDARIFDKSMKKLGYNEYMMQCGEFGYFVGRELGSKYTDSCKLLHFNFSMIQPHNIGIALNDDPMGISMWVGKKYNEAADPDNQKLPFWTKAILTTASLYYFTGCIMPSALCYYESIPHHRFAEFAFAA
ncbi:hypothetical protein W97_09159 [Coniosporium apollinis CBS 100218]|uniref:Epoxide hydrolase N-terminal domain-containing protein n=1 Tax=Coniosporium apollinis (strain CBS 100218) TaxID=1168221 RepID=R7Z6S6_CONA1|nr:uncharacterized protein W97_09159 [Coniosporium apollinis CBS 100218]EON69895.1 hypothetical protein W97_09159 [Coniosporium apollinis CBS 100218]